MCFASTSHIRLYTVGISEAYRHLLVSLNWLLLKLLLLLL